MGKQVWPEARHETSQVNGTEKNFKVSAFRLAFYIISFESNDFVISMLRENNID